MGTSCETLTFNGWLFAWRFCFQWGKKDEYYNNNNNNNNNVLVSDKYIYNFPIFLEWIELLFQRFLQCILCPVWVNFGGNVSHQYLTVQQRWLLLGCLPVGNICQLSRKAAKQHLNIFKAVWANKWSSKPSVARLLVHLWCLIAAVILSHSLI